MPDEDIITSINNAYEASEVGRADETYGTVRWYDNFRTLQDRMYDAWPAIYELLKTAERKAKAFMWCRNRAIDNGTYFNVEGNIDKADGSDDLLTAIEAALKDNTNNT